jgi:GGDEF domain-containing protein
MLIFLVCATISLLYFTSVSPSGRRAASSWPHFVVTAADRLARARRLREQSWAVLTVQLDDPAQLRSAAGESGWLRLVSQFAALVADTFPAEADLGREIRGRVVVVVSRPDAVLREHVRALLRHVTELDVSAFIDIQLSASIGWVPAGTADYDLTALIRHADAAASEATRQGGDRWERVRS